MHIPDGYLGPLTCLVMYAVMAPIWWLAARAMKEKLGDKSVPMLAMLTAVAFLVMMFNWPVPDGTTAHMVGGTLIAIILGPWAAVIGITVALVIQAFFFGDGGITALGANSFNMAFVLPFVGYYVYRGMKKVLGDGPSSEMIAAGVGAYAGINVAAIAAAIEFGIQPYISSGYCPYGLNLAIPAMAFAHLTTAGPVAAVVTSLVIGYMRKNRPDLLDAGAAPAEG
ncbi:MAG TPA: cobalt transporter CbiM [Thermoplasmatales archaeon]|nr:cobalt transporter CbiM [Thermoplasmatales archaeon]